MPTHRNVALFGGVLVARLLIDAKLNRLTQLPIGDKFRPGVECMSDLG
jgi:hypothetical protein